MLLTIGVWRVVRWAQGRAERCGRRGGWVGMQKLITDLDMRNGYKGGVRVGFININDMYNNDAVRGEYLPMKLMKQNKGLRSLECLFTS